MKKIFATISATALILALTACGGAKLSAYELYLKADEMMASATSVSMDIEGNMSMSIGEESLDIEISGSAQEIIRSETDIDMAMTMTMDMMGMSMETTGYYKDGYMYTSMSGMNAKMAMGIDEALASANIQQMEFGEDAVTSAEVTDVTDGKKLTFDIDPTKLGEILDSLTESVAGQVGMDGMDMQIGNMHYEMVVDKDNYMKSAVITMALSMAIEGQEISLSYNIAMNNMEYNQITEITFPADLDTYTDISDLA